MCERTWTGVTTETGTNHVCVRAACVCLHLLVCLNIYVAYKNCLMCVCERERERDSGSDFLSVSLWDMLWLGE